MKVTVCFGPVKVIVPCGDALTVQDLIEKSIQRYRKALGKDDLYWVKVHSLQSQSDGGILDGDDLVSDVADDREKLTALFEEEEAGSPKEQLISDGTSSVGTTSPINVNEMNHINNSNNKTLINGKYPQENGELDIVVTGREAVSKLQVRQNGSPHRNNFTQPRSTTSKPRLDSNANSLPHKNANRYDSDENQDAFDRFSRDSSRRSLSSAHPSVFKWAEAQQRIEDMANQNSPTSPPPNPLAVSPMAREQVEIDMVNDGTPLGIHIIARVENEDGSGYGLVVHGIENGGRAARDKRLQPGDHILAINGKNITQETFDQAQEMMRTAMRSPSVKLLIERDKQNRPLSPSKVPPTVPQRSPQTTLTHPDKTKKSTLIGTNTKRISRKLYIQLMKGPQSLGFSITTRDNPIDGKIPIYIKNILPNGAAIADGRLKPGDRLIEVNGIEMSGKTQEEAVSILRSVRRGGVVNLVVSRQEQMEAEPVFPRAMPADLSPDDHSSSNTKTILDFNIALNDTGSAGLGVSVKGKTTGGANGETKDLGIFIKSVMHGGAASKDGRLRPNDQLLCINDVSLVNMSNSEAMDTLRKAMSSEKSPRSTIRLVIARRQDVTETLHNALNKGEMGVEASVDRPIDVSRTVPKPLKEKQPEKDQEAEDVLKQPLMSDQSSLLQNISETLSAKHNVDLTPKLDPQHVDQQSEGRARVTYPGSTANVHTVGGMTLPSSGEDKALIENGGLHLQVGVNSPNSTASLSPQSPRAPQPPEWLANWENDHEGDGELSPVLTRDQFQRDSYARLSFSERKQGGSLDAKQMAWFKKTKGAKQLDHQPPKQRDVAASTGSLTRAASVDSLLDKQPITSKMDQTETMKKSNSMDRLNERDSRSSTEYRPSRRRLSRKNGLNESFRAAVDKSLPQQKDASSEADKSDIPPPMTRERKRSTKEKKKKEKETTTGTNSKGIKGFFRFGKSRKSISDDKDTDVSKDEESKISRQEAEKTKAREDAQDEQERIQEALRRQREESQEARTKAERMLELRQKYQNHRNHYPDDYSDEGEGNWQNDDRMKQRDQGLEDKDWRYERLSDGRSHPEREYRDSKGRIVDDGYRGRDDNYRSDEWDRRYKEARYRPESMDDRDRRYNDDRYRHERRRSDSYDHEHDMAARIGYSRDDRSEKRNKDGKRESPTEETEKDGKSSVIRRESSGKGGKKDKKKQKEGKERSDSEREDGKSRKTEQLYDTPQSPAKYAPSEGARTSRNREQGREEQRRYSQDRPDDKGYGRRNRSHERPRDRGDHQMYNRDRRSEDWHRDRRTEDWPRDRREDDRRDSRPYGGTERGPRRYPQDQRDFGSLDRHSQRELRNDHQRRPRDDHYHQDGYSAKDYPPSHRYPASGDPRHRHSGDPRYPQGHGHGYANSSRSVHQRSKSYDMDQMDSRHYDDRDGYRDDHVTPRAGYSRGYDANDRGYRQEEDTARV